MDNKHQNQQQQEFEALTRPVIEWLNKNWNPHVAVIVSTTHATLFTGKISHYTTDYVNG